MSSNVDQQFREAVPHILYDTSLPIEERKSKALRFPSATKAAFFLGRPTNAVIEARNNRWRIGGKDGKMYAVRIDKTKT